MRSLFTLGIAALLLFGCSSGRKALERGDYDTALAQAIKRLRSNSDHSKSQNTLRKAYRLSLELHQNNIERARLSTDELRWETISYNYQQINSVYDQILRCPGCREVVPNPMKYDAELGTANRNAAQTRYELGVAALKFKRDRVKAIEAHRHFEMARSFVPRFKDVEEKLQEALYSATLRVVIEPIPSPARVFNLRHEFFVNKVNEYVHRNVINEYVRFYTPDEVKSQKLDYVDHVIRMEFDQFSLGNVYSHTTEKEVVRDSVVISEREGEKIYGTVKAKLKINEKAITGGGLLDFRILDNDLKKVISQEKFPSEYTWSIRWATFNGDERALNEEELAMVKSVEAGIPSPQLMFEEFTAPLYDQVIAKLRGYYRGY